LLQAQARSNSIEIVNAEITSEHAIRIARCMRRDWMNARASLVDQYRNIEVVADQLEAGVDLVFSGSVANTGNNPFKIRTETGELQAGLQFDSPIVRLSERNDYRLALIDYQQAKRSFYQFEDSIKGDLRELVRNLGRNRVRFELDRRTVQVQIENVEINRLELDRPISDTNTSLGTTTARNLTEAIIGLNAAQNDYLSTWVQYEVFRRNLDFDMGTMQLDSRGQWIDPGPIDDQARFAWTSGKRTKRRFNVRQRSRVRQRNQKTKKHRHPTAKQNRANWKFLVSLKRCLKTSIQIPRRPVIQSCRPNQ